MIIPFARSPRRSGSLRDDPYRLMRGKLLICRRFRSQNQKYWRVFSVPVAPYPQTPKPANPPSAGVTSPPPPPPPGGPEILIHISDALMERSFTRESLYILLMDKFRAVDSFADIRDLPQSFGGMNLDYPLELSLESASFKYERTRAGHITFTPTRIGAAQSLGALTSLDVDFEDLTRVDKKDTVTLVWGTILGAGVALLADGLGNLIAQVLNNRLNRGPYRADD